jgi:hypothetical protein
VQRFPPPPTASPMATGRSTAPSLPRATALGHARVVRSVSTLCSSPSSPRGRWPRVATGCRATECGGRAAAAVPLVEVARARLPRSQTATTPPFTPATMRVVGPIECGGTVEAGKMGATATAEMMGSDQSRYPQARGFAEANMSQAAIMPGVQSTTRSASIQSVDRQLSVRMSTALPTSISITVPLVVPAATQ